MSFCQNTNFCCFHTLIQYLFKLSNGQGGGVHGELPGNLSKQQGYLGRIFWQVCMVPTVLSSVFHYLVAAGNSSHAAWSFQQHWVDNAKVHLGGTSIQWWNFCPAGNPWLVQDSLENLLVSKGAVPNDGRQMRSVTSIEIMLMVFVLEHSKLPCSWCFRRGMWRETWDLTWSKVPLNWCRFHAVQISWMPGAGVTWKRKWRAYHSNIFSMFQHMWIPIRVWWKIL